MANEKPEGEPERAMFKCFGCGKRSGVGNSDRDDGRFYIVCEHCGAKNEAEELAMPQGYGARHRMIGLLKPRH